MPQIDEVTRADNQLNAAIGDALRQLGIVQAVAFQCYSRVVLPLDGYVFWSPTVKVTAAGVLHFAQQLVQEETEILGLATLNFVTEEPLVEFAQLGANTLFVATIAGFRYAFEAQGGFQDEARLWHYSGHSVYPALASQLLDPPRTLDPTQAIVSNSLPAWLALNGWSTPFSDWFSNAPVAQGGLGIMLYPSFLVTPNLPPPYVAVHIGPEDTRTFQAVPYLDANRSSWQLNADRVRLTLYGLTSNQSIDFLNCILQYIEYSGAFGLMNMPTVLDGKRYQVELRALGMQKFIDMEVSYLQNRIESIARTLIESASAQILINQAA